ncbi:MAG: flagellar basal-body MS-ring/collar protein FliF [Hyphomicrobiales bacterium]|nr:flagellar basal-body MS-ring/collar protein FliF [Hyphomicrobiales bacterium]
MLTVTAALLVFFGFVMFRFSQPTMGLLYSDLSLQDAAQIVKDLETRNIKYESRGDGSAILVPRADIPRVRMELASKGLPSGGGVGYEIFDKGDAFSSTSFVQNINHLRALEGELTRTIRGLGRVQNARVHLVIPERKLFERDREPPRASIVLRLRGDLEAGQIRAIRHLVASAVEGLKPERVSIVDEGGRLLADGAQSDAAGMAGSVGDDRQTTIERRVKAQIEEIVASVVGSGRARVQVSAQLEMNRVESRSETFDPESRVARSTQSRTESSANSEPGAQGVTVGNELPGAQGQGGGQAQTREQSSKNEEITNFEISRTTRTEVLEGGRLRRLSVAVLVDGVYARPAAGGDAIYQPRPQEELDRIGALVRTAIGFDRQRGDQVEVVNLRFADAPQQIELKEQTLMQQLLSFTKEDVLRAIELGVIALLTLIVLITVVRPLLKQVLAPDKPKGRDSDGDQSQGGAGGGGGMQSLPYAADGQQMLAAPSSADTPSERMLALAQIRGQIKAQSVEKIGGMVNQNPSDAVAVLRSWVHEQPSGA